MKLCRSVTLNSFIILLLLLLVLIIRASIYSAKTPELKAYHQKDLLLEDFNYDSYSNIHDYLKDEQLFFNKVEKALLSYNLADFRYNKTSEFYFYTDRKKGNLSSITYPTEPKGVALVVHGLSDSPYHMEHIIKSVLDRGYIAINMRLPGHGTGPGALLDINWRDWKRALDFFIDMAYLELGNTSNKKFITIGFSTGGALLIEHTLEELYTSGNRIPDKLILYSPAASITSKALLADLHKYISWMPGLKKFKWMDVLKENDPYKYNSFPKNAAYQIYMLTEHNKRLISKVSKSKELLEDLPPIITFQSPYDSTVEYKGIVSLYNKIANRESKLILFSNNRFYSQLYIEGVDSIITPKDFKFFKPELLILKNIDDNSSKTALYRAFVNSNGIFDYNRVDRITAPWPKGIFALSHVSTHIKYDDEIYGLNSDLYRYENYNLIGESGLLNSESSFIRLKFNPFYDLVEQILNENI